MTRVFVYLLGLLLLPAFALAQSDGTGTNTGTTPAFGAGGLLVTLFHLDGKMYDDLKQIPVSKDQCDRDVELMFQVMNLAALPTGSKYLQLWVGTNCTLPDNRDQVGETDCDRIDVDWKLQTTTGMDYFTTTAKPLCDRGSGTYDLYFLPASNTSEVAGAPMTYGYYKLAIDKDPPDAPSDVSAGKGETEIPVEWTVNDTDVFTNWLIWDKDPVIGRDTDASVGDDGGSSGSPLCSSSILKEGDDTDLAALMKLDNIGIDEVMGNRENATVSGSQLGARRVAMAVAAADLAGNVSKLSNIDCLEVVATEGFWDAYKAEGGDAEPGCACATPGSRTSLDSGIVPIALVVLAWGVRRRRARSGSRA